MFDRRDDMVKLIAVAEAGKFVAAAEALNIAPPALTRTISKLEGQFGGRLFERLPTGVRLTPLGAAEEKFQAAVAGRVGNFRVTATPMWMQAVLTPAVAAFRESMPGVALTLRTASFAEGLRLMTNGDSDLHCGGADTGEPLPAFLRREPFLDTTAGIVAHEEHPLLDGRPAVGDLSRYPWIDFDAAPHAALNRGGQTTLDRLLGRLFRQTGKRASTILHAGAASLFLMATGPWLAWLPLEFLERLPEPRLRPVPTRFGHRRTRTGFVARRSAEDLAPFRALGKRGARRSAGTQPRVSGVGRAGRSLSPHPVSPPVVSGALVIELPRFPGDSRIPPNGARHGPAGFFKNIN